MRAVAEEFGVSVAVIRSSSRFQHAVLPRHVVALLAAELTSMSNVKIGILLGRRDHTTIIHAVVSVRHKSSRNPALAEKVQRLRDKLLEKNEYDDSST